MRENSDRLLNAEVTVDEEALQEISPFSLRFELDDPPTMEEVRIAVWKTKANESPSPDGIPTEIYKSRGYVLTNRPYELIKKRADK